MFSIDNANLILPHPFVNIKGSIISKKLNLFLPYHFNEPLRKIINPAFGGAYIYLLVAMYSFSSSLLLLKLNTLFTLK